MSKPRDRRNNRSSRPWEREVELIVLQDRLRRERQANEAAQSPGADLARARWEFWHRPYFETCPENGVRDQNQRARAHLSRYLDVVDPEEADGHLGTRIGLRKRSNMAVLSLKIVDYQRQAPDNWLLTACGEIPEVVKKGFRKLKKLALHQMHNGTSPAVGEVRGVAIEGDVVGLTCRVDPTAILKVTKDVYSVIDVSYSDRSGRIYAVDLMDRPTDENLLSKRGSRHLARLYESEEEGDTEMRKLSEGDRYRREVANKAVEILNRAIVPDSSDIAKRQQGYSDFEVLYYGLRQQLTDQRFTTRR